MIDDHVEKYQSDASHMLLDEEQVIKYTFFGVTLRKVNN